MSRVPGLLVRSVLVLVLAAAVCVVLPGDRASAVGCYTRDLGDRLPVLLVHGFQSSPEEWGTIQGDAGTPAHPWKLHGEVPRARGTWIAQPFDYEAEHSLWVQGAGSTAPRRLAE